MSEEDQERTERQKRASYALVVTSFLLGLAGALAFAIVYWVGRDNLKSFFNQALGLSFGLALGGIGCGLVLWAHGLMPHGPDEEERKVAGHEPDSRWERQRRARRQLQATLEDVGEPLGRRPLLRRLLMTVVGVTGITALFPLRSLGSRPFPQRAEGGWHDGVRLVGEDGRPVRVDELDFGSVLTVFPEGMVRDPTAQAVLLRVPPQLFRPLPGREDWVPEGYVAYSKLCTHAGCPVGLYQTYSQRLFCPCHQSTFDVVDGAKPSFGPSKRPLPQLPLGVEGDFLVARGDFSHSVGPGYWNYG